MARSPTGPSSGSPSSTRARSSKSGKSRRVGVSRASRTALLALLCPVGQSAQGGSQRGPHRARQVMTHAGNDQQLSVADELGGAPAGLHVDEEVTVTVHDQGRDPDAPDGLGAVTRGE